MNISYNWLRDFVDFDLTAQALANLITSRATTVDAVETLRDELRSFVVARVVECGPHSDSDHLSVTKVDAGTGELLDVVCGAPNVQAGKLYPFAKTGTTMPAGFVIERRKIRGAVSNGMLCSARELGLGDEHEGILELDIDAEPGTPLLEALPGLSDTRLDIDVAPNRPDLLSHLGVAREVAAALGRPVDVPRAALGHVSTPGELVPVVSAHGSGATGGIRVTVEDADGCPRYLGVVIRGVRVGPSPDWLVRRLAGAGVRSINNIVDVTNFMLLGFGQPMHAFDAKRLGGQAVVVRRPKAGEKLTTLDGVERELTPDMCVIADAERAQALAGVMGGQESEVTSTTTDVFLEVAAFNPRRVRQMRRALSISSEASYRFERGTDVNAAPDRLREAAALIVALAGGTPDDAIDVQAAPLPERPRLMLRTARVKQVLGDAIPAARIVTLLRSIGFDADVRPGTEMLDANEEIVVSGPTWRRDIDAEIDLIEEVARLHGYDQFSDELRPFRVGNVPDSPRFVLEQRIQDALAAEGLFEVRPLPFVAGGDDSHVRVANPIAESEPHLRTSILESLASRAEFNLSHMEGNIRLFEVGATFTPRDGARLPEERMRVGVLIMGDRRPAHFTEPKPPRYDAWDAKGLAERLARVAEPRARVSLRPAEGDSRDQGELWSIELDGVARGVVRTLALDAPVWAATAFGIELDLGTIDADDVAPPGRSVHGETPAAPPASHVHFRPLPTTPAAPVDLALLIPDSVSAAQVERVIRNNGGDLLERLAVFDEYRGSGLPAGTRSVAWRLTFRDPLRTLRDKEIEGRTNKILRALEGELGVRQRTA